MEKFNDYRDLRYLELISEIYPTIAKTSTEIINLQSILNLPKATEHFITDVHGEYEAFSHVLRNGSGAVKKKIDDVFERSMTGEDKKQLATLIYYPKEKINLVKQTEENMDEWYLITLFRLIEVCKRASSKYTRSKIRKALPEDFAYVIEELITEKAEVQDKEDYYMEIIRTIISIGRAEDFIIALSELIQRLVVDHLHIVGDIYDRGSGAHRIMNDLMDYHSFDVEWGNHDILWMGAAAGQKVCIATVIRICARYGNLDTLEDGYGINMLPLANFAMNTYRNDPCSCFKTKRNSIDSISDTNLNIKMHKAISVIQFKLEGQLIEKYPDFQMSDRAMLHRIDYDKGTIKIYGKEYELLDTNFPTVDPEDPYRLTEDEENILNRLQNAFMQCELLQSHMQLLLNCGNLYKTYNGNLLFHGCVPLNKDGSLKIVNLRGRKLKGRELYDELEKYIRKAFFSLKREEREEGRDILWYVWTHRDSPLFGKQKMATFERYFLKEKETHEEVKNPYYDYLEDEKVINSILKEFGVEGEDAHIINGHVPVLHSAGESPIKCGGKVLVIDGGFSKAYQKVTGIAGYTLTYNSYGMTLVAHEPFTTAEDAVLKGTDIHSSQVMVQKMNRRQVVGDTDNGKAMKKKIADLKCLLKAYRSGLIPEKRK